MVTDESGHLVTAAAPSDQWPGTGSLRTTEAIAVEGNPNQVRIGWLGGACDGPTHLTVAEDATIIRNTEPSATPGACILIGITRDVVVPPSTSSEITVSAAASAGSPLTLRKTPWSPAAMPEGSCGPSASRCYAAATSGCLPTT